jgi:Zn finger protein HypA/HybF involved in hydrogenase expression
MIRKEYKCKECEFKFERTIFEDEEGEVSCPVCGCKNVELVVEEEKKPQSCSTSSKYT